MADQATVDGARRPAKDLRNHLGEMAHDVSRLAELQARLLAADLSRVRSRLLCAAGCGLTALALLVLSLPVALAGFGLWLADVTRLTPAGGLLSVSAGTGVVILILAATGWIQFRRQRAGWQQSKQELRRNLQTLRQVILGRAGMKDSTESMH